MGNEEMLGLLGIGAITGAALTVMWIAGVVIYLVEVIGLWKVFTKAGEKGWKSIIPIYNQYIMYKISWNTKTFWKYFVVTIAAGVANAISESLSNSVAVAIFTVIFFALGIIGIVYMVKQSIKMAKAYGKGTGFGVCMFFFQPICQCILGYGKAQYVGPQDN